jgi:hypothetical protein
MTADQPRPDPSVAGLARELELIRRAVDGLAAIPSQVADLAGLVAGLADRVGPNRGHGAGLPSWLDLSGDFADVVGVLGDLAEWLRTVYLRYTDGAAGLPECWLWHPDVVEELLWLRAAWTEAYAGESPSAVRAGEWHDRQRPGVVRRIRAVAGTCSLEAHQPPGERHRGAEAVPLAEAIHAIGEWWATNREATAPAPGPEHIAAAAALRAPRRRR